MRLFANGWSGFGLALQAYSKRAVPLVDWVVELARKHNRTLMVRLVKGAYWDSEIKAAQVAGLDRLSGVHAQGRDRRLLSRLRQAHARRRATASTRPSPRTTPTPSARSRRWPGKTPFEFQRLHGMGEGLYDELAKLERGIGETPTPVRIYAPVGSHKELLAYLVRRLLENGANSSFVNRIADDDVPVDALVRDPVAELAALEPKRNPAIPLPDAIFGKGRRNSAGVDLSDPLVREPLVERLASARRRARGRAAPTLGERRASRCRSSRRSTPR